MSNLKILREKNSLTQTQLAEILGISVQRYNMYELGKRKLPSTIAVNISKALNASLDEIFVNAC
ncbi:MAG: Helix-turn-helix domain [Eubacterium sp.]|jgi:putative transcriptional regulator|nr:Helix-turn-helix domain [Eubacterium sp.]